MFARAVVAKAKSSTVHIPYINPYGLYHFHSPLYIGSYLQSLFIIFLDYSCLLRKSALCLLYICRR
jgi:hypothetical protein